jgi:hypothetical protein
MTANSHLKVLIDLLDSTLRQAASLSHDAMEALNANHPNLAMGTLQPLETQLEHALALYRAAYSVHRHAHQFDQRSAR